MKKFKAIINGLKAFLHVINPLTVIEAIKKFKQAYDETLKNN